MKFAARLLPCIAAAVLAAGTVSAQAQIRITEVAPWGSGNAAYASDWFELTNFGSTAVTLTDWRMDDNSNAFGSSRLLAGITSIAAGESVVFTENAVKSSFLSTWFGANAPTGLQIGTYTGNGVGLSTDGDAVNIFNAAGALQARVTFGTSDGSSPFQTFDNAAGLNAATTAEMATITQLSAIGVNGAFVAANSNAEIGSPGQIAAVPEPETYALMLAGLGLVATMVRRHRR